MRFALGLFLCLAFPALAVADAQTWRYAQWGMTPEEVVAASKGQASLVPYTPPTPETVEKSKDASKQSVMPLQQLQQFGGAGSQLEQAGVLFNVSFLFDEQSRKLVQVIVSKDQCALEVDRIKSRLVKEYGKPVGHHKSDVADTTTWKTNSEMVEFGLQKRKSPGNVPDILKCMISYEPLP